MAYIVSSYVLVYPDPLRTTCAKDPGIVWDTVRSNIPVLGVVQQMGRWQLERRMVEACAVGAGCILPNLDVAGRTLGQLDAVGRNGPCPGVEDRCTVLVEDSPG